MFIYSYINTRGNEENENCAETRRPKDGVFSHYFEFLQISSFLNSNSISTRVDMFYLIHTHGIYMINCQTNLIFTFHGKLTTNTPTIIPCCRIWSGPSRKMKQNLLIHNTFRITVQGSVLRSPFSLNSGKSKCEASLCIHWTIKINLKRTRMYYYTFSV